MSFKGKVVLITGADSGIGAAIAIHLAQLGASLSITGRNIQNLNRVAEQCGQPMPHIIMGELTNEDDVKKIIDVTIEHYSKLNVLINNRILKKGNIKASFGSLERCEKVNVDLLHQLIALAVPHLTKTKGNIVNVSIETGTSFAVPDCLPRCMSKSVINQLTRCVALKLVQKQVRVNAVNPGFVVTTLDKSGGSSDKDLKKHYDNNTTIKKAFGIERSGDVSEVAKTIAFLASDDASYITGVTLPVDGGKHIACPH